jgi:hypothetical protein
MKTAFKPLRNGVFSLALLAGVALLPQAALAGSLHDEADFGGTWEPIAPSDHYHGRYAGPFYYAAPVYLTPGYAFGPVINDPDFFGPPLPDDGPGVALVAPDVGVAVEID